ncbi:hypothetical protein SAMN06265379_101488 [Saccharicrinis carchari]|uniref:Uncharacterized protein n=1 Tax=Saccharicrinis carchari TaxID=1168039 RepID=A0A521AWS1_SACCC|nr:hypothetical protein SAMN06265379_101488 [Saccharicrinis carchari]
MSIAKSVNCTVSGDCDMVHSLFSVVKKYLSHLFLNNLNTIVSPNGLMVYICTLKTEN